MKKFILLFVVLKAITVWADDPDTHSSAAELKPEARTSTVYKIKPMQDEPLPDDFYYDWEGVSEYEGEWVRFEYCDAGNPTLTFYDEEGQFKASLFMGQDSYPMTIDKYYWENTFLIFEFTSEMDGEGLFQMEYHPDNPDIRIFTFYFPEYENIYYFVPAEYASEYRLIEEDCSGYY